MTSNRHHNYYQDNAVCFWTSSIVNAVPVLRSPTAARRLLEILDYYRSRYGVRIIAYVIMPDHIHLALWAEEAAQVRKFLAQVLKRSSGEMAELCSKAADNGVEIAASWLKMFRDHAATGSRVRVWRERGRAFPVTDLPTLQEKLRYIHENPVRKGLVERPEDWPFSSAAHYAGGQSAIPVDSVDW